jgi:hypothetical protein
MVTYVIEQKWNPKLRRFTKHFPNEAKKLQAITGSAGTVSSKFFIKNNIPIHVYYNDLNKQCKNTIPNWE